MQSLKKLSREDLEQLKVGDTIYRLWYSSEKSEEQVLDEIYERSQLHPVKVLDRKKSKRGYDKFKTEFGWVTVNSSFNISGTQCVHSSGNNYRVNYYKEIN